MTRWLLLSSHICFRPFQKAAEQADLLIFAKAQVAENWLPMCLFHVGHGYSIPCLQKENLHQKLWFYSLQFLLALGNN